MMPSEPDKKMDDLVRTYARKRREDAGESLEMHPATRRLLQAEAAKLRPSEATPQRTLWTWLFLRWPRVAFAVGLFVLLAVAVWKGIPDRGQSSLFAKRDEMAREVSPARDSEHEGIAKAQLGDRVEQDKDVAKQPEPEAKKLTERSLDEVRQKNLLREPDPQSDLKLKKESVTVGANVQQTPSGGLKPAEAPTMRRTLDAGATSTRFAGGEPANRPAPQATSQAPSGLNLALTPGADASGRQRSFTYSAPGSAPAADAYSQLPLLKQASPQTNAAPFFKFPAGPGLGAERQPADLSLVAPPAITPPAVPSPNTSAVLAFETRNNPAKAGRADFGEDKLDGTASTSLADRSQVRARVTGAGEVLVAKGATQSVLPRQSVRFKRQAEPEKPAPAKAAMEPASAGMLSTFEFEQDGDQVRVIDSDGSVYAGGFVSAVEAGKARFAEMAEESNRPALAAAEPRRQSTTPEATRRYNASFANGPSTTNRVFRVNGTNRTSGQFVTLEASLTASSEVEINGALRGLTVARPTAPAPAPPAVEPKSKVSAPAPTTAAAVPSEAMEARRLVGVLRLGASNEVKLIAVPVAK
jgi:hypothetical protein